jgi:PPIC-type PPIASE domain
VADVLKRLLREPLLHFLLLGAAIFAGYGLMTRGGGNDPGKIVVTQGQLASMFEGFTRTRQRAPTREEWEGLIRDRVQDEVYYREALALGLDKDDLIIRRRLRQKMEFVSEGLAPAAQPSDAELQAYLNAHAAAFATEPRFSFRQVYLDPRRRGANLARDTERLLTGLNQAGAKADLANVGDPIPLEHEFDHASAREIANAFGEKFAAALGRQPLGQWQGPVASGYGVHLVFLAGRSEGETPALQNVRDDVRREWSNAQQREAAERFYRSLLKKYSVTVETPPSAAASASDAVAAR